MFSYVNAATTITVKIAFNNSAVDSVTCSSVVIVDLLFIVNDAMLLHVADVLHTKLSYVTCAAMKVPIAVVIGRMNS